MMVLLEVYNLVLAWEEVHNLVLALGNTELALEEQVLELACKQALLVGVGVYRQALRVWVEVYRLA